MSDRHIPLQLAGDRVVGVGPMTSPDQALLREALNRIIDFPFVKLSDFSAVRAIAREALALTRPSPPAGGETDIRSAIEREEKYLHALIDDEDVGSVMHGDIEGAFHRLLTALAHPIASESGRETASGEQMTGDIVESLRAKVIDGEPMQTNATQPIGSPNFSPSPVPQVREALAKCRPLVESFRYQGKKYSDLLDEIDRALTARPSDAAVAWQTIAETLCAVDGNGFMQDAPPTQYEAYKIRAKAVAALYASPPEGAVRALEKIANAPAMFPWARNLARDALAALQPSKG